MNLAQSHIIICHIFWYFYMIPKCLQMFTGLAQHWRRHFMVRWYVISVEISTKYTSVLADWQSWGHLKLEYFQFSSLQLRIYKYCAGGDNLQNPPLVQWHRVSHQSYFLISSIPYVSWICRLSYFFFFLLFQLVLYIEHYCNRDSL